MGDVTVTEWGRAEDRIRDLEAQVATLTAERDRYRAALVQYADSSNWRESDPYDGFDLWIGGTEGWDLAVVALSKGATESEATNANK